MVVMVVTMATVATMAVMVTTAAAVVAINGWLKNSRESGGEVGGRTTGEKSWWRQEEMYKY
jgi:hypothetical protein